MDELISKRQAINVIERNRAYIGHNMERAVGAAFIEILNCVGEDIGRLPSIQLATDTNVGTKLGTNLAELGTDCISRQAAIEVVQKRHMMLSKEKVLLINDLEKLPSAQPEIIRCKDCIYSGTPDEDKWRLCYHDGAQWNEENHYCGYAERREVTT